MKRILVTGHTGILGAALMRSLGTLGTLKGVSLEDGDLANPGYVAHVFEDFRPDCVIHSAAVAMVDFCERNKDKAFEANVVASRNIADQCACFGAKGVYISSDYIFDGRIGVPYAYQEIDLPNPRNFYGVTKFVGENCFRSLSSHLIVRTSWLFGGGNITTSFVLNAVDSLSNRIAFYAIDDQTSCPTYSRDLAEAIAKVLTHENLPAQEILNVVNAGSATFFGLACEVASKIGADAGQVKATTRRGYADIDKSYFAERPARSCLSTARLAGHYGLRLRQWQDALAEELKA